MDDFQDDLLHTVINTAGDGVVVVDELDIIRIYNPACERLFQRPREEAIGQNFSILVPELGELKLVQDVSMEARGCRRDGSVIPLNLSFGQGRHGGARITVVVIRDLTRSKDEEAARRLLSDALDAAPILIRDVDGTIRLWTRGMEVLCGYRSREAVGRRSHDLLSTEFPEPLESIDGQLLAKGNWSGELSYRRKDGERRTIISEWTLYRPPGGYAVVAEFNHDATAEREIEAARNYLASIVDSSTDAIIAKRLDGTVTAWNAAAERMFGYTAAEMIGQPILKLFPQDLLDEEDGILDRLQAGAAVGTFETRRLRKDGSELLVSLTISPIRNANGVTIGASKIVRDITERKKAEQRLNSLQAELIHLSRWNMMGSMASSIAHELNQPLAAITNYLAALKRIASGQPPNEKLIGEVVEKAVQQGQRAAAIIHNLRALVAKGKSERKEEDVVAVTREALQLVDPAIRQFEARVTLDAGDAPVVAQIDRVQIQQVIINLVRNAAEAMADEPLRDLCISIVRYGQHVKIEVSDTGPGLPKSVADRLFDAFVTTRPTGMGLGLSICQQIVTAHGGRLAAIPNKPHGMVFSFTLPLAPS